MQLLSDVVMKTLHSMFIMKPRPTSLPAELNKDIIAVCRHSANIIYIALSTMRPVPHHMSSFKKAVKVCSISRRWIVALFDTYFCSFKATARTSLGFKFVHCIN